MAQRKPTPIQTGIELVPDDLALPACDPIARAIQRPAIPTRTQLLAERQAAAMQFQTERSKFAITKNAEIHDHASAEMTASLLYAKHLEHGFGDDLTEQERTAFGWLRQDVLDTTVVMATDAAARLRAMARDRGLPVTDVTPLEVIIQWLQTH